MKHKTRASIDIGSNSLLLLIGEVKNGVVRQLEDLSEVTGLGKGLDVSGVFAAESMEQTELCLNNFCQTALQYGIQPAEIIVTATEASRVSKNSAQFYARIKNKLGLSTKIITAEGEAYYTALGVAGQSPDGADEMVILDIGGASTELIKVRLRPFKFENFISLPMGSVRGKDWLIRGVLDQKIKAILDGVDVARFKTTSLVCVAGTMTSLGGMIKGIRGDVDAAVHGAAIPFAQFKKFYQSLSGMTEDQIRENYPMIGKRAATIVSGARVGLAVGESLKVGEFSISKFGLRYGTMAEGEVNERFIIKAF